MAGRVAGAVRLARVGAGLVATPVTTIAQVGVRVARRHPWIVAVALVPTMISMMVAGTAVYIAVDKAEQMRSAAASVAGMAAAGGATLGGGGGGGGGAPLPGEPVPGVGGYTGPKGSTAPYDEPGLPAVTRRMLAAVVPTFGRGYSTFCWGERDGPSDHETGHACDFMMARHGTMPTAEYTAHGWAFCYYLIENAATLRVKYIIWQEQIWQNGRWRRYTRYGPGAGPTQNHYDHVHVSLFSG